MKTIAKSLLGFMIMLCLTTGCDLLNYDEIEKDQTEQAPGGGDTDPCKKSCE